MQNEPNAQQDSVKSKVNAQFSQTAASYRISRVHAQGPEFDHLLQAAAFQGHEWIIDAGCGAGHTAAHLAPHVEQVIAVDLSRAMLDQAAALCQERGLHNVQFIQGDVENLDAALRVHTEHATNAHAIDAHPIDAIVSRFSAHHWPQPAHALQAFRRTLAANANASRQDLGRIFLMDVVSLDSYVYDTHLQAIELLRDPSHIRDHSVAQWANLFQAAGYTAQALYEWDLTIEFVDWVTRMQTPAGDIQAIRRLFAGAPDEVKARFHLDLDADTFTFACALIQATPAS